MPEYPTSLSIDQLRERAVRLIESGGLPVAISHRLYAGMGRGQRCKVCEEIIAPEHVEYEVPDPRAGGSLVFHIRCHSAWQLECLRRLPPRPPERVEPSQEQSTPQPRPAAGSSE